MNKSDSNNKLLVIELLNLAPDLPVPTFIFPDNPIPNWNLENLNSKIGIVPSAPLRKDILYINGKNLFYPDNPNL